MLEYNYETEVWNQIGELSNKNSYHAVSTVPVSNLQQNCQNLPIINPGIKGTQTN